MIGVLEEGGILERAGGVSGGRYGHGYIYEILKKEKVLNIKLNYRTNTVMYGLCTYLDHIH